MQSGITKMLKMIRYGLISHLDLVFNSISAFRVFALLHKLFGNLKGLKR